MNMKLTAALGIVLMTSSYANAAFSPMEVIPTDGAEVASLSKITVVWPAEWLEEVAPGICGRVENATGDTVAQLTCEENYSYNNAACDFLLSERISDQGVYTVFVDAAAVMNEDEEESDAFQLTYRIIDSSDAVIRLVSAIPENNAVVASLSKIETEWSDRVKTVNTELECAVFDEKGTKITDVSVSKGYFSTDPVVFTLEKTIDTQGTFTLSIPSGLLVSEDGVKSEAVDLTYTVDAESAGSLTAVAIDPEDHSVVALMSKFSITWDADFEFGYEAEEIGQVIDEYGITVATLSCEADWLEDNVLICYLSSPLTEAGEYTVEINAGTITASNGLRNEAITLAYTIDPSKAETNLKYWLSPTAGQIEGTEFPDVEFIFDEEIELLVSEFTFESSNGDIVTVPASLYYDTVTLDCHNITNSGIWTLTVPEGAFRSLENGSVNAGAVIEWIYDFESGVNGPVEFIQVEVTDRHIRTVGANKTVVYDINGNIISDIEGDAEIKVMPGIYFVHIAGKLSAETRKIIVR